MRELYFGIFVVLAMTALLVAATPVLTKHMTLDEIDAEFDNIYATMQDQQFTTVFGTPTASTMISGRLLISSTGTVKFCTAVDSITVYCTPALTVTQP